MDESIHIAVTPTRLSKLVTVTVPDMEVSVHLNLDEITRNRLISALVRTKYSSDDMEALVNNMLEDPSDNKSEEEYKRMLEWRRTAKNAAGCAIDIMKQSGLID